MSIDSEHAVTDEGANARRLMPKLRFPEFHSEWQRTSMREVYRFKGNNPMSRDQLNYDDGDLKTIHYGDIHTKFAAGFRADEERVPFINRGEYHPSLREDNWCSAGDMVFADASEDMNDVGKAIEIIDAGSVPLTAGMHTILARPELREMAVGFGRYLFASSYVRRQIQGEAQGAKVLGISPTRLGSIKLPIPADLGEQQKIADCMSSLDALITAEGKRLAALRALKNGLMQGLFPAPGQIIPRLRFPEFQKAGQWEERPLSTCIELVSGLHLAPEDYSDAGELPYFSGPSDLTDLLSGVSKWTSNTGNIALKGDILLVVKGSGAGDFSRLAISRVAIGRQLMAIRATAGLQDFLMQALATKADLLKARSTGNLIPGLARPDILNLPVFFPPTEEEQRRVAGTLSSIDSQIAALVEKLQALKIHKSGLMQRLFPSSAEVVA